MPYRRSSPSPRSSDDATDLRAEDIVGVRETSTTDPSAESAAERARIRRLAVATGVTVVLGALVVIFDR